MVAYPPAGMDGYIAGAAPAKHPARSYAQELTRITDSTRCGYTDAAPDGAGEQATRAFQEITEAYDVLSDPSGRQRRRAYNDVLRRSELVVFCRGSLTPRRGTPSFEVGRQAPAQNRWALCTAPRRQSMRWPPPGVCRPEPRSRRGRLDEFSRATANGAPDVRLQPTLLARHCRLPEALMQALPASQRARGVLLTDQEAAHFAARRRVALAVKVQTDAALGATGDRIRSALRTQAPLGPPGDGPSLTERSSESVSRASVVKGVRSSCDATVTNSSRNAMACRSRLRRLRLLVELLGAQSLRRISFRRSPQAGRYRRV